MSVALDGEMLPVDSRFQRTVHRLQKVVAVGLDVEADQVGAQQAVQQLRLPRADAEASGFGQGICQKIATRASGRRP